MRFFNPANWYWTVGGSTEQVYSSAKNGYVPVTDQAFLTWLGSDGVKATPIATETDLWPCMSALLPAWLFNGTTFAQPTATTYTAAQLEAYTAAVRYDKETGGIALGGVTARTDRESQGMIGGAYSMAVGNSAFTTYWKGADGSFTELNAPTIIALGQAVGQHVSDCFSMEADVVAQIRAGTLHSLPEINAAFAAI